MSGRERVRRIHSMPVYNQEYWEGLDWEASAMEAWSWYSPTSLYYAIRDPTTSNLAKVGFQTAFSYGAFALANAMTGSLAPYHPFYHSVQRAHAIAYNAKKIAQGVLTVASNPYVMITASTAAHAYTASEIEDMQPGAGAQASLALQYANTGSFSGGSMPVIWGLPGYTHTSSETYETQQGKTFLEDLWMTATGGIW